MEAAKLEHLKNNVAQVNIGDDIITVVDVVGIPDVDQTIQKNEKHRFFYYLLRDSPRSQFV